MLPINRSYLNGSARWGTVNVPKYIVVHYRGHLAPFKINLRSDKIDN